MKRLLLTLLLPALLWAQVGTPSRTAKIFPKTGFATQLNGSTQYWSKSSPSNLDLNGSERLANTGFETDTSNWTVANGTYATSTAQKKSGNKSVLLIATAAAASITSETITDATTDKGTGEIWVYCASAASTKSIKLVLLNQNLATIDSTVTTVTAVTWTKLVKNKQWPGTQTGLKLRVGFNGGAANDSLYIDDVSLTQAWDALCWAVVTPNDITNNQRLFSYRDASDFGWELQLYITENIWVAYLLSGSGNSVLASTAHNGINTQFVAITWNRTGNATVYVDGVAGSPLSIVAVGKIVITSASLSIGRFAPSANQFFNGRVGYAGFVRFAALPSDIATTIARINSTWKRQGFPKVYVGGTIVLDIDWKNQGMDKSNSANHLTPIASPPIIQTKFQ